MDFGVILDAWEKQSAKAAKEAKKIDSQKPSSKKKNADFIEKKILQEKTEKNQKVIQPVTTKNEKQVNPMDMWLRRYGVVDKDKMFEELVIEVKSVVKVNKGGRQRRFSATVVVGDRKGKVGLGTGKANEVPDAIKKAIQDANKHMITIPLIDGRTVAHEAIGTAGAARVIIKPAAAGTGVIAGGSVRAILELAGIRDVVSKSLGARTKLNMATAALNALKSIKTPEQVAALRGKTVEEILG